MRNKTIAYATRSRKSVNDPTTRLLPVQNCAQGQKRMPALTKCTHVLTHAYTYLSTVCMYEAVTLTVHKHHCNRRGGGRHEKTQISPRPHTV